MTQAAHWSPYETPRWRVAKEQRNELPLTLRDRLYSRLRQAAGGLGWSRPSPDHDADVERLLGGGLLAVEAILDEVAACSREEVLHEAAEVLAKFQVSDALLAELGRVIASAPTPVKRAVAARALGYLSGACDERLHHLARALVDVDAEVRDRAAMALEATGDARALGFLENALGIESVAIVRESITDAIESLRS